LLLEQGRYPEARTEAEKALEIAHRLDLNPAIRGLYQSLAESFRRSNRPQKALEYLDRAFLMERRLLNEDRLRNIDELEIRYQKAETEKRLALAENENLLQSRQLLRHRWANTLLGAGLLTAVLLLLLFRQQKRVAQLRAERQRAEHEQTLEKLRAQQEFSALQAFFTGQEQERRRIANDLHDSLGGLLYALRLQLSAETLDKARQTLETAAAENRRISQDLLPPALARMGLCAALREWSVQFERQFDLPVRLDVPDNEIHLPDETAASLFRIAQELMTNAAKHAQSTLVCVRLLPGENLLTLEVEDYGIGIAPLSLPETAFKTVRSRAHLLGGRLQVDSAPDRGTLVRVETPVTAEITQK